MPGAYVGCASTKPAVATFHLNFSDPTFDVVRSFSQGLSPVRALSTPNVFHACDAHVACGATAVEAVAPAVTGTTSAAVASAPTPTWNARRRIVQLPSSRFAL